MKTSLNYDRRKQSVLMKKDANGNGWNPFAAKKDAKLIEHTITNYSTKENQIKLTSPI